MNKTFSNIVKYIIFLSLGVFLIWWSLHQIPDDEMDKFKMALKQAHYWLIIPVFIILSTSHVLRALRWKILMEPLGYKPSTLNTFFAVMIGYLVNMAVPRLGEVLKCTIIAKYEKVPAEKIVGTIVAERAFDVVCLGIVFVLALLFQFDVVSASFTQIKTTSAGLHHGASNTNHTKLIVLAVVGVLIAGIVIWLLVSGKWKSFTATIKKIIVGIWEGLISVKKVKHKWLFIFYSVAIWTLYIVGTWIGLYATEGTGLGFKEALSCLALASIGMILTPGGIGSYALLIAIVLREYDVDYTIGLANGTLQWFSQFIIVLVVGFISVGLLPWYNKKKSHETN
ncbi:lysylphosphatidylglycerol synthase transmembrane domain-containing protein [Chitinophagaceae bacterium LWZ2-11]